MGREFELKFRCSEDAFAALQGDFPEFVTIQMETTYYDTFDGRLGNNRWTLRRRYENGKAICTLKTPCPDGGRGEWEVEAEGIMTAIPQLVGLGAPAELMAYSVSGVAAVCGAKFTRIARKINFADSVLELALDSGVLLGGGKELPLYEVEVELLTGETRDTDLYSAILSEKFHLQEEKESKFRRAMALAKGEI